MTRNRILAVFFILLIVGLSYGIYASERMPNSFFARFPFKLGLDLAGGTELTYRADVSKIDPAEVSGSMEVLRDLIERRVNIFGVSEPIIQVEEASVLAGNAGSDKEQRLIVGLPGVTDINEAVELIGKTPLLEFKLLKKGAEDKLLNSDNLDELFIDTELTGRYLEKSYLEFIQTSNEPVVSLVFNDEGRKLFADITKNHVDEVLAIFLDNEAISLPVIRQEITDGQAQISGNFSATEARDLVRDLNYGALPVPIELIGTESVGASLGEAALYAGVRAGIVGLLLVALFLILWYRFPGLIATVSLILYTVLSLVIFKLIPVTMTAAGLAGFILSIGMAVDANVLVFERLREELKKGKNIHDAVREGFARAWYSIRDSNISSLITALVLFWVGTSSVKGFALTFGIGVLVSMFTAITASRIFLFATAPRRDSNFWRFLFSSGLHK